MRVIDIAQEVVRLGKENPDFVYNSPLKSGECVYVSGGEGSCIVGQALINLGVDIDILKASDYALVELGDGDMASSVIDKVLDVEDDDSDLIYYIDDVQREQDQRTPWGAAIVNLSECLEEEISERQD